MRAHRQLAENSLSARCLSTTTRTSRLCWNRTCLRRLVHSTAPIVEGELPFAAPSTPLNNWAEPPVPWKAHNGEYDQRTEYSCNLNNVRDGTRVTLVGWIQAIRQMGGINFLVLRDHRGTVQLVYRTLDLDEEHDFELAEIPLESVVSITGTVQQVPDKANKTGYTKRRTEVIVRKYALLNPAQKPLPFYPTQIDMPNQKFRSQHRVLDLRREEIAKNLRIRSQATRIIRDVLEVRGFLDVETPILLNSTPEGAHEFLVPTRVPPVSEDAETQPASGEDGPQEPTFYALAQSPQQPKQLLICSGAIENYYQFAKCFRDEDGRKDRQPEFTQLDLEMAFVSWSARESEKLHGWRIGGGEVKEVVEEVIRWVWRELKQSEVPPKFRVLTYHEAMSKYGSDKPDTRIPLEIVDLSAMMPLEYQEELKRSTASQGRVLDCLRIPRASPLAIKNLRNFAKRDPGIIPVTITEENQYRWVTSHPHVNFDNPDLWRDLGERLQVEMGDHLFLRFRDEVHSGSSTALGDMRLAVARLAEVINVWKPDQGSDFLWVTEFPLFTKDPEKEALVGGEWSSSHHPFTAPMAEDIELLMHGETRDLGKVRGQHYDLVLNGVEIGGGSVRIHDAELQHFILEEILKLDTQVERFSHLLQALRFGAPPHGGIALGFDRLMSIICNTHSIREVIAFPKNAEGRDPVFRSPSRVPNEQLRPYRLRPSAWQTRAAKGGAAAAAADEGGGVSEPVREEGEGGEQQRVEVQAERGELKKTQQHAAQLTGGAGAKGLKGDYSPSSSPPNELFDPDSDTSEPSLSAEEEADLQSTSTRKWGPSPRLLQEQEQGGADDGLAMLEDWGRGWTERMELRRRERIARGRSGAGEGKGEGEEGS